MINHLICLISIILPATRCFPFKRFMYKFVGFKFKENVSIGNCIKSYVLGSVEVGRDTWLGRNLDFTVPRGTILTIGSNVDVAPYVRFQCGSHIVGTSFRRAGITNSKSISIGDGCWIGSSSVILAGAQVGKGTVIAAGSVVVSGGYPDNILLAGVPAKIKKKYSN